MADKKILTLDTPALQISESLSLKPAELDDAERYLKLVADNYGRLSRWIRVPKPPNTVSERKKAHATDLANSGHWWLIEVDSVLVGTIALHHIEPTERWALVGYWLGEEFTGNGFMTLSLNAVLDWAFSELGLNRVEIQCALSNVASSAIPERLGIQREAIRRQSEVVNGVSLDMASYAAFADNWPPKPPARALPHPEILVDDEILLRQHVDGDREAMWAALDAGRKYLSQYLPWMSDYPTEDDHARGFDTRRWENDNFDGSGGYIVEYKGELAGTVGFGVPNRDNGIEMGYWLREDLQGRGIMTRSVEAIITMLIVEIGLRRVTIRAATSNLPSRGIPERLGFTHEGTMRDGGYVKDEYLDLEIYSMLDHEWVARSERA
jgi:ribosomal-protein-serine acetyltransferase